MVAASVLICSAAPLAAQQPVNAQCASVVTQDACQKALDVFQYLAPQLGAVIAGGNATLGVGGTLGGLGRIYISGRANVVSSNIPRVDEVAPSTSGARSDQYPTQSQIAGIPQADVAIGLFQGIPLGVTNVGGVDLLGSVSYLPSINASGVHLTTPNGSFKVGGGVRLGIIQESILFPGISVTYLRRALPTVDLLSSNNSGDTLRVDNIGITTDSYRIVASKTFLLLGIAAGAGQDRYTSSATGTAYVAARTVAGIGTAAQSVGPISMSQKLTRTTYFVDGTLNFPIIKIIGEIGRTSAVNVPTYNSFAGSAAGAAQTFGALGIRLGL
ncbi:MAG TPA: hypothetical protein VII66_04275 [Gemmatimonadaceae bacterium]